MTLLALTTPLATSGGTVADFRDELARCRYCGQTYHAWYSNQASAHGRCADNAGHTAEPPADPRWEREDRVASLRRQGCTLEAIADREGVTRERVRQILLARRTRRRLLLTEPRRPRLDPIDLLSLMRWPSSALVLDAIAEPMARA